MTIEIPKEERKAAIASIERYFSERMDEPIGNLAAMELLDFFIKEISPIVYNVAVADVQKQLQARVQEIGGEVFKEPFRYWRTSERDRKK